MLCLPLHYLAVLARHEAMSSVRGVCSLGFGFCGLLSPDSLKQRQDAHCGSLYVTQQIKEILLSPEGLNNDSAKENEES